VYLALYLAFVPQAAKPGHPIDDVLLDGDLTVSVEATGGRDGRLIKDRD